MCVPKLLIPHQYQHTEQRYEHRGPCVLWLLIPHEYQHTEWCDGHK